MKTSAEPSNPAEVIANLVLDHTMQNTYYDDTADRHCTTPDYDAINRTVPKLFKTPESIQGTVKGLPVKSFLKIAIIGGFSANYGDPGKSDENYEMIEALYDATKEDKEFWEESPTEESSPKSVDPKISDPKMQWIIHISKTPAALLAAQRMSYEYFNFGDPTELQKSMAAMVKLCEKIRHIPAFQEEFESREKFCSLQDDYERLESDPENQARFVQGHGLIRRAAQALIEKDYRMLTTELRGPLGMELETAVRVHLCTGKTNIPILEKTIQEELTKKTPKVKRPEITLEEP